MAPKTKTPPTQELAPRSATAGLITGPYVDAMANPDPVLVSKGGDLKVYREVLRDDQVKSTFQQRRLAVVSAPWDVEPGAEDATSKAAAEELKRQLQAIKFDEITDHQLYAIFYGYGVAEVMWGTNGQYITIDAIKVRDRSRFRFGVDDSLYLQMPDWSFRQMPDRKFWVINTGQDHADNPYGTGLAHWLYWPTFFKRTDIKFWLIFLEKFGQPTAIGKLPAGAQNNKELRNKLLQALSSIATDAAVVIPDGAEIELLEAARSGAGDYKSMHDAMDAAIAKIVLSQTMTTDNGSSRSQAEVHAGVRDLVVKADADLICESFNRSVVRWWAEYNFPGAVPPRVWRNTEPADDLNARAERDQKVYALGYEPTEEYITETYGPGWQKRQQAEPVADPARANPFSNAPLADFAESLKVTASKALHRQDQQQLAEAARQFASQYEDILGARVEQLVNYAETSGDYETFRKQLIAMFSERPGATAIEKAERANFFSRLMGARRAQR